MSMKSVGPDISAGLVLSPGVAAGDGVERGQPPGEGLGAGDGALVAGAVDDLGAHPDRVDARASVGLLADDLEAQAGRVLELLPPRREVDHRDAVEAVRRDDVVAGRQDAAVDDEHDVRGGRALVRTEAGPLGEVGRQQRAEVVDGRAHHPHGADGVGLLRALRVGEPLEPVPVLQVGLGAQHRDDDLLGAVEGDRARDHGPREGACLLLRAADLDAVEGAQVDRGRQSRLHAVHHEQPVQGRRGGGVDLVDGRALRRHQLDGQRLRADPPAHLEEVGVAGRALPQPGAVLGHGGQGVGGGVVPGERLALPVGRVAGRLADAGQVAQVLRARPRHLLVPLLALAVDLHRHEAERREEEHARREHRAAAGRAALAGERRDDDDRADAAQHRDGVHEHAAGTLVLLDLGRRLQHDLPGRHLGCVDAVAAAQRGAHTAPLVGPVGPLTVRARAGRTGAFVPRRTPWRNPRRAPCGDGGGNPSRSGRVVRPRAGN
ncbi:hypothetical protein [Nocardioides zeae]|uniref:Uncharacterized protein n=1 Tax=Nocardioides zeae TaxID=1457234 RepID=A0AAJ1U1V4_9ACTN|nr:hypothetical protein [Nocardioides zeae]MDQ1105839.1 hypothetical protein [Nocardioides zeae]